MSADLIIGRLQQGSFLHPRGHPPADADPPPGCLLARTAYIYSLTNDSTAVCRMTNIHDGEVAIQVTFVVAHPPRVSYFCAHCTGAEFDYAPVVIDTEGQFALLYMCVGSPRYYVYQPDGSLDGGPSLTLLPHPSCRHLMERNQIGLFLPPRHGHERRRYLVAALFQALASPPGQVQFDLYVYDSKDRAWTVKALLLPEDQQEEFIERGHYTSKVITIGGDRGTMAFVDPTKGILFCHVLDGHPAVHYLSLPEPLHPSRLSSGPWSVSDVAFNARINQIVFVELHSSRHGWQAAIWTATTENNWRQRWTWSTVRPLDPSKLDCSDLVELLPNEMDFVGKQRSEALPIPDLQQAYIELPTLNLYDNTVYFLTKHSIRDRDGWVIAVDMADLSLRAAAQYFPGTGHSMFGHSTISNHRCMAAPLGNLERTMLLPEFISLNQQPHLVVSYYLGELKQQNYYGS